ncbi:hypothetical protein [Paenibacillus odorifer]|uniref:hypothetical protein n=1 Tax=Paenibacillus odorifer TaxID=189426 RepID=UPI0015C33593|nr:hypothetical protein [Paenibacillus odorifer]
MKKIYVNQLSEAEQKDIITKLKKNLTNEGFSESVIEEAISDALCSKITEIQHALY